MAGHTTDGAVLELETVTPGTYAVVAQVISQKPPAFKRKVVDVYVAGQAYPERMVTNEEPMEHTFELLFDPDLTGHTDIFALYNSKAKKNWRIKFPDPTPRQYTFSATVTGWEDGDMPADGKELTASVTLTLHAKPTVT